jgi:hypothetical protein
MSRSRLAIVTVVMALLGGTRVQAQQPQRPDSMAPGMMAMSGNCMRSESAIDQRLSRLVDAMNAAPPNRRVAAMMAVMNELAIRDREMRARMTGMMDGKQMMGMMHPSDSVGTRPLEKAPAKPEALKPAPDSAAHEQHH